MTATLKLVPIGDLSTFDVRTVPRTDALDILVRWNDWGPDPRHPASTQDIDIFLARMKPNGSGLEVIAKSVAEQAGSGPPLESIHIEGKGVKGQHFLLLMKNARVSRSLDVHVFAIHTQPAHLDPETPVGSVSSPASASYAIGVGAWDVTTNAMADYSSQGPTDDNRLKPEVAAPAGLPSAAYGAGFDGTSASCPHVAGFAALIKQLNPAL